MLLLSWQRVRIVLLQLTTKVVGLNKGAVSYSSVTGQTLPQESGLNSFIHCVQHSLPFLPGYICITIMTQQHALMPQTRARREIQMKFQANMLYDLEEQQQQQHIKSCSQNDDGAFSSNKILYELRTDRRTTTRSLSFVFVFNVLNICWWLPDIFFSPPKNGDFLFC